jgi:hypothetical protein
LASFADDGAAGIASRALRPHAGTELSWPGQTGLSSQAARDYRIAQGARKHGTRRGFARRRARTRGIALALIAASTSLGATRRAEARETLDDRLGNARVTISTLARQKIPREGKKTLASMLQRA